MAGGGEGNGNVGFEEGMSWLPSHVHVLLDGLCDSNSKHSKSGLKPHHRPRHHANGPSGGPGMQAIFLDSGRKSCGTGVFLPRRTGKDLQPNKKSACAPVLLPYRVVQALNLDVHELGLQLSPRTDIKNNPKTGDQITDKNKEGGMAVSTEFCVISQKQSCSPEIFLPKEWTY